MKINEEKGDEDVWLTQAQIVEIYHTSKSCPFSSNVSTIFAYNYRAAIIFLIAALYVSG